MKRVLQYIWQLPQNVLGLLLIALYKPQRKHVTETGVEIYYSPKMTGGISLGKYVLMDMGYYRVDAQRSLRMDNVRHEAEGHARQSLLLGWLYLIVVGLPSIVWAGIHRIKWVEKRCSYWDFYTERWADNIAGIQR